VARGGPRPLDDILANGVRGEADVDGIATLNGDAVQVLIWNYHDDIVTAAATPVHLALTLPARFGPRARVSHLRVDTSHGDAYSVWVSQGLPASPSAAQIAALQAAMAPAPLGPDRTVSVADDGGVAVDFDLPRFGVSLVTITPGGEPTDGGSDGEAGVDAGGPPPPPEGGCGCRTAGGDPAPDPAPITGAGLLIVFLLRARRARAPRHACK
jgi:MYXO-CTERM domain-containing protein